MNTPQPIRPESFDSLDTSSTKARRLAAMLQAISGPSGQESFEDVAPELRREYLDLAAELASDVATELSDLLDRHITPGEATQ